MKQEKVAFFSPPSFTLPVSGTERIDPFETKDILNPYQVISYLLFPFKIGLVTGFFSFD